jgi:hypothetical protein
LGGAAQLLSLGVIFKRHANSTIINARTDSSKAVIQLFVSEIYWTNRLPLSCNCTALNSPHCRLRFATLLHYAQVTLHSHGGMVSGVDDLFPQLCCGSTVEGFWLVPCGCCNMFYTNPEYARSCGSARWPERILANN